MKKLLALLLMMAVLCTAFSGLTLVKAEGYTLVEGYAESSSQEISVNGKDRNRGAAEVIYYSYSDFDVANVTNQWAFPAYSAETYAKLGKHYTYSNQYGYEIAVNNCGIVVNKSPSGNMQIPEDGYVISAHNESTYYNSLINDVQVGDAAFFYSTKDSSGNDVHTVYFYRTTNDSSYTHDTRASELKKSGLVGGDIVRSGEDSPTSTYDTDVLVKLTQNEKQGTDSNDGKTIYTSKGYVVKYGNFGTEDVPEGYMVLPLSEQSVVDNESTNEMLPKYSASYAFERYGDIGAIVTVTLDENRDLKSSVFFRFDACAAVRNALLLTGMEGRVYVGSSEGGTEEYCTVPADGFKDSARVILEDAKTNYRLVDIAQIQSLYDQMVACTKAMLALNVTSTTEKATIEQYHATIKSLYQQIYDLSFETRTVEMRATWWTPMERKLDAYTTYTADDWDAHLETEISRIKNLGYNMIFVETLFNSTVIFPEAPAYNGVAYQQNPYLVPDEYGGLNTVLTEPYDMLQKIVDICKANHIEPHVQWMTCYVAYRRVQDNSDDLYEYSIVDKYLLADTTKYANWLNQSLYVNDKGENFSYQVPNTTTYQYFLNPQNADARQFVLNTVQYIMKNYDIESLQLDYCRYPAANSKNSGFGFDSDTLEAFKQSAYYDSSVHTEAFINSESMVSDSAWAQFRANYVTEWVKGVYDCRENCSKDLYITASPDPDPDHAMEDVQQDVRTWLGENYIDVLFPMAYGQNVPEHITPIVTSDYPEKFVCIGTDNDYFSEAYEMNWLRVTRKAGADGIASFCESEMYANEEGDVWKTPAITPTGDATRAAMTYIADTVNGRIEKMLSLENIDEAEQKTLLAATEKLSETIRIYGIDAAEVATAFDDLQTTANSDTFGANPANAIANDITYLKKIRNNSRDAAKENAGTTVDPNATLTIGGISLAGDNNKAAAFAYSASTNVLIVTATTTLTGKAPAGMEIYIKSGNKTVHFNNLTDTEGNSVTVKTLPDDSALDAGVKIRLSGTTAMDSVDALQKVTFYGVGVIKDADGTILRMQGDVTGNKLLQTDDVRTMLRYNVGATTSGEFGDAQEKISDANGDGKVNTTDSRLFLEKMLNMIDQQPEQAA